MAARERSVRESQTIVQQLCEANLELHEKGQQHIARLEAKADKAIADFEALAQEWRRFRSWRIIRLALVVARMSQCITRRFKSGFMKNAASPLTGD
ncbi:MAG: hypothetical protein ACLQKA_17630 [Bryobacteraceae bacterium]